MYKKFCSEFWFLLTSGDIMQVGALVDLKRDMAHWRSVLQAKLVEEIESAVFVLKVRPKSCD